MKIEAYAKINLTLEVFAKRVDGYHALRSVVLPVSLGDTLEIVPASTLSSDAGYDDDLCVKAAKVLDPTRGAAIHVEKRIPVGGGLGGGSADAAATLIALNELWQLGKSRKELAEIAVQVGSDVPALTLGGAVLMEGRGECVSTLPIEISELNFVLVNPKIHSSTKAVYANCSPRALLGNESATVKMIEALAIDDLEAIAAAMVNDLQPSAIGLYPEIAEAMNALRSAGAIGVMMSGSGSTVFGLVPDQATAEKISREMFFKGYRAWAVKSMI